MLSSLELQALTARAAQVTVSEILSKKRSQSLIRARHIAMLLCRDVLGMSYPEIGRAFRRDHTSGVENARIRLEKNEPCWRELLAEVRDAICRRPITSCVVATATCSAIGTDDQCGIAAGR
jgi:hypothetical protein